MITRMHLKIEKCNEEQLPSKEQFYSRKANTEAFEYQEHGRAS